MTVREESAVQEKLRKAPFRQCNSANIRRSAHNLRASVSVDGFTALINESDPPESWARVARTQSGVLWHSGQATEGAVCAQPARGAASYRNTSTSNGLDAPQEQRVTCVEARCITSPDVRYEALPLGNGTCKVPTRYNASNRDKWIISTAEQQNSSLLFILLGCYSHILLAVLF